MIKENSYLFSIKIDRLKVHCHIGWYDWEHEEEQPILVTMQCMYSATYDITQDKLSATLDYDKPKELIIKILKEGKFKLLEAAAIEIKSQLMAAFPQMKDLKITLEKPKAITDANAAIISL